MRLGRIIVSIYYHGPQSGSSSLSIKQVEAWDKIAGSGVSPGDAQFAMQFVSLLLGISSLSARHVFMAPEQLKIDGLTNLSSAHCPCCGGLSSRVYSQCDRKLTELPAHGVAI